jgi:cytochrome bd-type quinol oxidase subunit 2
MTKCLQAVVYAVSAAVSAFFFATWKRADDDLKSRVWRRYGWFCALAFVGSVGGLVTAAADSRFRYNYQRIAKFFEFGDQCRIIFGGSIDNIPGLLDCYHPQVVTFMNVDYWLAVSPVPYAIEFLCICCAKLLVRAQARPPSQSRRPHP